jgi:hypothetical protein
MSPRPLPLSDFTLYIPFAIGVACLYVIFLACSGRLRASSWQRVGAMVVAIAVSAILLGPYCQRLVTHVVDREGGGAAGLSALAVFITGAIAYVVFIGQQYESSRVRTETDLQELAKRSETLEGQERETAGREAAFADALERVEASLEGLSYRVQHETFRAIALSSIDSGLRERESPDLPTQRSRVFLILLRDLVGRTTPSVAFDVLEVEDGVDRLADANIAIGTAVKVDVARYLESLGEGMVDDHERARVDRVRVSLLALR